VRSHHPCTLADRCEQHSSRARLRIALPGIDHNAVKCSTSDLATHRLARAELFKDWRESEFEIVNTTFLSDLDY